MHNQRPGWQCKAAMVALLTGIGVASGVAAGELESLTGIGLDVRDPEISAKFYRDALGFEVARRIPEGSAAPRTIALSLSGKADLGLIVLRRADDPLPPGHEAFGRIITTARDGRAAADRIRAAGYAVTRIVENPNGPGSLEVWTRDPDGYAVEVFQPPRQP